MPSALREPRRLPYLAEASRVVPGLYGWVATVLTPALQRGAPLSARASALFAVAALVGSFALSSSRPRAARLLGVYGFMTGCFSAWVFFGPALRADQLDPVRGALGALGFLLHALAWGAAPRAPDTQPLDNLVPGAPLQPRHPPGRAGSWVLALGIGVSLLPVALAFGVERPGGALLAHAVATGCALLLVGAASDLALRVGKAHPQAPWRARASRSSWPLGGLILAIGLGLSWLALR
jgi:hypothetical protein